MTTFRGLALGAFRWLALALCAGFVFELTCRVEDWVMYRMPIMSRYTSVEDLLVHDADGMHGRRDARFEKWAMNNVGTRGPDVSATPAPGSFRIVTVGASETFGLRESPGREFPRQLEDTLNAHASAACGTHFEVLNAAFAGMTVPTIVQDIRNRLSRLRPTMILTYVSPSAYLEERRPVAARPDSSGRSQSPGMGQALHPRALARLRDQFKAALPGVVLSLVRRGEIDAANRGQAADQFFTTVPADRLADFDSDLRELVGTIRSVGATPLLVTHGNLFAGRVHADSANLIAWVRFAPRATGPTLIAFDSLARLATLRVARDSAVAVADATTRLSAAPASAFADYVHFTDLGAATVAGVAASTALSEVRRLNDCGAR